jgi:hypothetical protein
MAQGDPKLLKGFGKGVYALKMGGTFDPCPWAVTVAGVRTRLSGRAQIKDNCPLLSDPEVHFSGRAPF